MIRYNLETALSNFMNNALYYMKYANKEKIYITLTQEKGWNVLHFKDTGPGIVKDSMSNVFNRFFSMRQEEIKIGLGFVNICFLSRERI